MLSELFKVKMLYTSNKRFEYIVGRSGLGRFYENMFLMNDFHTSYVKKANIKDKVLTIETRNSTYKFEILEDVDFEVTSYVRQEDDNNKLEDEIKEVEQKVFK